MSLTYAQYVTQLANFMVVSPSDANYLSALPSIIDDAEQRTYRDLDLLATRITNTATSLSSGSRTVALSTTLGTFLVVEEVNVITPSTATAATGTRVPLVNVSRDFINAVYPSNTSATNTPEFWSMTDNANIIVGPSPDAAYPLEVIGTIRPTPLSSANQSTILTTMLPDVFMAASLVYAAGYMKDFGAMSDDPQAGATWEALYQKRLASAATEEFRKKYTSQAWTSKTPAPFATPARV